MEATRKKQSLAALIDIIDPLDMEERGRLFTALLVHGAGRGDRIPEMGNERFAYAAIMAQSEKGEAPAERRKTFHPPTLEEVAEYCRERKNGIDPQEFIDHYSANGWMRGKTKISDWKACVRTWEGKRKERRERRPGQAHNHKEREYSAAKLGSIPMDLLAD